MNKLLEKFHVKINSFMILTMFFFYDLWYIFFMVLKNQTFSFMIFFLCFFNVFFYDLWYGFLMIFFL